MFNIGDHVLYYYPGAKRAASARVINATDRLVKIEINDPLFTNNQTRIFNINGRAFDGTDRYIELNNNSEDQIIKRFKDAVADAEDKMKKALDDLKASGYSVTREGDYKFRITKETVVAEF